MRATIAELPGIYAGIIKLGAQVVAIQAVSLQGQVIEPPPGMIDSKGPNNEDVEGAQGFAWIADHSPDGAAFLQVSVVTLKPPYDQQHSAFIDVAQVATYVATGQPKLG